MALLAGVASGSAVAQHVLGKRPQAPPVELKQASPAQMPASDRSIFEDARGRLARAARLFGYQMQQPGWTCNEVVTPDVPDYVMVICRRPGTGTRGAYAFSATISRSGNAVYVIPVMYGGATPWKTAANMKTSREIFNRVVPARIAAESVKASGKWLQLGMTYTALTGDDSVVLTAPSKHLRWLMAPEPTILMRDGDSRRTVIFSDTSPGNGVRIWTLTFNRQGKLIESDVKVIPDLKPHQVSAETPQAVMMKHQNSPIQSAEAVPAAQH